MTTILVTTKSSDEVRQLIVRCLSNVLSPADQEFLDNALQTYANLCVDESRQEQNAVHHTDGNRFNNDQSNLKVINFRDNRRDA